MKLIEHNYDYNETTNSLEMCGSYFTEMVNVGIIL